jgi:hypothetical protein
MGGQGRRNREQMDAHNARKRAQRAVLRAERWKEKEEEKKRKRDEVKVDWRRRLNQEVQSFQITPLFVVDDEKLDLKTVALRFLLSGRGFSDFTVFQNFEKEKLGNTEFLELAELVYTKVDEVADKKLEERRKKLKGKSIFLEIDCRWGTRGFDAKEATVSGFDDNGDLLTVINLFREGKLKYVILPFIHSFIHLLSSTHISSLLCFYHRNCSVEAKGMEGLGVKRTCEMLKEEGIKVETMLHDADSSSYYNARSIFPNMKELYCNNHSAKNLRYLHSLHIFPPSLLSSHLSSSFL